MKKTWFLELALALGASSFGGLACGQTATKSFSGSTLGPSGFEVSLPVQTPLTSQRAPSVAAPARPIAPDYGAFSEPASNQLRSMSMPRTDRNPIQATAAVEELVPPSYPTTRFSKTSGWNSPLQSPSQLQPNASGALVPSPPALSPEQVEEPLIIENPEYARTLAPMATSCEPAEECVSTGPKHFPRIKAHVRGITSWCVSSCSKESLFPGRAWFVGSGGLLFRRVDDHNVGLAYDTTDPTPNVLTTGDARQHYLPGFEVFGGRYFNSGRNAIMVNYWGLFPEDAVGTAIPVAGGNLNSRIDFDGLQMPSQSASDWFDGAAAHRVVRGSQYQNLEINLLGFAVGGAARSWNNNGICGQCGNSGGCGCGDCNSCGSGCAAYTSSCSVAPNMCGSRLNWTWLAGLRWFHFSDRLEYAASESDTTFNSDPDDLYYHNDVINNLFGIQLGGAGTYCLGKRFNVYGITKAGIYNNHSELETCLCSNGASAATATIVSDTAYNGQDYYVNTTQNNAAFLGELGTGLGIRISRGWSGNIGYRAIGASGVATAVNSIPLDMRHLGNVAEVNDTSSLLLHGLTLGGMYNF